MVRFVAYVGADTRTAIAAAADPAATGITLFHLEPETGDLTADQTFASDNPFAFALHPTKPVLYSVNLTDDYGGDHSGSIEAFTIDQHTGRLTLINRESTRGALPAQPAIDPTGRWLVVANYTGGNVVTLPVREDGAVGPVACVAPRMGSGPNPVRQTKSYPHAAVFDPTGQFVAVADLGTDQTAIYRLDPETGAITVACEAASAPGAGPRHVAFNADGTLLYVVNELDGTIDCFAFDGASGLIGERLQTISTHTEDHTGERSTAEILIHPSGRFLYNSNRGQPDSTTPEGDAIVAFTIDPEDGQLTLVGHTTVGIAEPWSFAFDPAGRWLYAANHNADSITQYAIDPESGRLSGPVASYPTPAPFVIQIFALADSD